MSKSLEKCPFCRHKDTCLYHGGDGRVAVRCNSCGTIGANSADRSNAIRKWNFASEAVAKVIRETILNVAINEVSS